MTGADSRSTATVASPAAARTVVRPAERRFLEPFVGRELSPAQAAREAGVTVEQMAYRVRALTDRGLLRATRTEARAGRPVTHYRAADEIRVPVVLLPEADTRAVLETVDAGGRGALLDALAAGADRSGLADWVVLLRRAPTGEIRVDLTPGSHDWTPETMLADRLPAVLFHWAPLALDAARAKDLQRELSEVLARYQDAAAGGTTPSHLLGLFLAPLR